LGVALELALDALAPAPDHDHHVVDAIGVPDRRQGHTYASERILDGWRTFLLECALFVAEFALFVRR
jgi:hypothetical protein